MRNIISFVALASIFVACGETSSHTPLENLIQERDSIKSLRTELAAELATLDDEINSLDTGKVVRINSVTTRTLKTSRFEHFFTIQGSVETDENALIYPEAAGRVTNITVNEGDRVKKGQMLLKLDNSIVVQQMQELKSRLSLAEIVFKKQEALWKQEVGSEIQYLESKNNFESLKQSLETVMAQSELYSITAPFSGIIDEINLKEGEMAGPQMPAIRLVNTDDVYIKSDVTERYLGEIKAGDSVRVVFPSIESTQFTTISRIGEFINPNNRTFKVRLDLTNKNGNLKPNLLGELNIRDYVNDSAVVIPSSIVQMTPSGESFVYILDGDIARKTTITTGMSFNDEVEVVTGLTAGSAIIEKGARSIKDGDVVKVSQ